MSIKYLLSNVSCFAKTARVRGWLSLVLLAVPLFVGCATVPQADVQTFATGITTAKTQADTAFQAVADLSSQSIIDYAAQQPTLSDTNFLPVLDPESIAMWDEVFGALQKYSQNLAALSASDLTKSYEDAAAGLATEIKQAGDDLKAQDLILQGGPSSPGLAAAFTELGDLLMREKAQRDSKKILLQSDSTVRLIFTMMAEAIGSSRTNGLRSTVHAHWEQLKAGQKLNFISAKASDRQAVAAKYANLLNSEVTQDLALDSLATSLLALADAHHALANNNVAGVTAAISVVEQELQRTVNLSARFQAISKGSN